MSEFRELNFKNNIDLKTLSATITQNYYTDKQLQKTIQAESTSNINTNNDKRISSQKKSEKTEKKVNGIFLKNIDYYLSMLNSITDFNNLEEKIMGILPQKTEENYHMIILRLKMELLKNIKEINDLIDGENLDVDELLVFKDEIRLEKEKINTLAMIEEKKSCQEIPKQENTLIFAKTSGKNIRVLEEIFSKSIDPVYYSDFKVLFNSIKDGTFNGFKKFHSSGNSKIRGYQLRKDATRLVFDRIGPNTYAIITVFIKKCTNDNGYKEALQNKIYEYSKQRNVLIKQLNNKVFIEENRKYEKILFEKLNNIATAKTYRKEKKII